MSLTSFREGAMGIFDKAGDIFDGKSEDDRKKGTSPSFSDVNAGSTSADKPAADFSDVTSGESTSAPTSGTKTYTVKSGDSLSKIAKAQYGDASEWKRIYDANRDKIKDPDLIHPGQEFTIPDA